MIGPGIAALLESNAACKSIIGAIVYPVLLPETPTLPCASYQIISNVPTYTLDGAAYSKARLQIDAWGNTYDDAVNVAEAIRLVLDRFEGHLPNGFNVSSLTIGNQTDYLDPDSRLYRIQTDWLLLYSQPQ